MRTQGSAGNAHPAVWAVVLNWRDAPTTRACIAALQLDPLIASIVVVDNESTGELRELQSESIVLVEHAENLGFARGVNSGIRTAFNHHADAVLAVNNDTVIRQGAVKELVEAWLSSSCDVGLLAPRIVFPDGTTQPSGGFFRALDASTRDGGVQKLNYLTWACVLLPRRTVDEFGYLDERYFMYWEDVEYGLRITDAGKTLQVVEAAVVEHSLSKSHKRAGARIDRYSARGLVLLCCARGGIAGWVGLPLRLTGRLVKRIAKPAQLREVVAGAIDGVLAYRRL